MTKIIIADDHPLYRSALIRALEQEFSTPEKVETHAFVESSDLESTISSLEGHPDTDLLLLDLHMPGNFGLLGLVQLRKQFPSVPIVIISASDDVEVVGRVMAMGVAGFIPKSASTKELVEALSAVSLGQIWVPEKLRDSVFKSDTEDLESKVSDLTSQQYKVLYYLTEGWLNKQIAYDMKITEATVKAHVTAILRKLDCSNRTQAVILAQRLRLDPPHELSKVNH